MEKLSTSAPSQQPPVKRHAFDLEVRLSAASAWKGDDRERFRGRGRNNPDGVVLELYVLERPGPRILVTAFLPDWTLERLGIRPHTFAAK